MQSHFHGLVGVAVVAVVDDVECFHVGANNPVQHFFVLGPDFVEVQGAIAGNGFVSVNDLLARHFVATTIDGVEQGLCSVDAGAEELHLLADLHGGDASSQKMVMFGSGAGPRLRRVWSRRKEVLVTRVRPSSPKPASDQVAQ